MANPQHKTCLSVLRSVIGSAAGNEARFAKKIGRSTSWLKKASCGQIPLTEKIALRIACETGIGIRWLMKGDTSKTPVDKDDKTFTKATYENYRSPDYFPGKDCDCEASSSYECGCDADWTPVEVYKLREDAKQLADRLTALELHSTSELARLERERDEAREKVEQQRKEIVRLNGATNHAGGTPLKIALRERDEALSQIAQAECRAERFCQERDEAQDYSKDIWKILRHSQDEVLRLTFENRELSQSIEGWENKWKCAIDMAARAELERDEALKCAKEYYVEFIRNASSDNKVSKPNPLNPFYKLT